MGFKIAVVQVHVERPVGGAGAASSLMVYPKKPKFLKSARWKSGLDLHRVVQIQFFLYGCVPRALSYLWAKFQPNPVPPSCRNRPFLFPPPSSFFSPLLFLLHQPACQTSPGASGKGGVKVCDAFQSPRASYEGADERLTWEASWLNRQ